MSEAIYSIIGNGVQVGVLDALTVYLAAAAAAVCIALCWWLNRRADKEPEPRGAIDPTGRRYPNSGKWERGF